MQLICLGRKGKEKRGIFVALMRRDVGGEEIVTPRKFNHLTK